MTRACLGGAFLPLAFVLLSGALCVSGQENPAAGDPRTEWPRVTIVNPVEGQEVDSTFGIEINVERMNIPEQGVVALFLDDEIFGHVNNTDEIVQLKTAVVGNLKLSALIVHSTSQAVSNIASVNVNVQPATSLYGLTVNEDYKSMEILSPFPDDIYVHTDNVTLSMALDGFDFPNDKIGIFVNQMLAQRITENTPIVFQHFPPGENKIQVALINDEGVAMHPFIVQTMAKVVTNEEVPSVEIVSPVDGKVFDAREVQVSFALNNFKIPEDGFVFVMLDGEGVVKAEEGSSVTLTGVKSGRHEITLVLGTPSSRKVGLSSQSVVFTVSYFDDLKVPEGVKPASSFVAPVTDPLLARKDLAINVIYPMPNDIYFEGDNILIRWEAVGMKVPEEGMGIMVLDDREPSRLQTSRDVVLTNLTPGPHNITIALGNLDGKYLTGLARIIPLTVVKKGTAPSIVITSPTNMALVNEASVEIQYRIDGGFQVPRDGSVYVSMNGNGLFFKDDNSPLFVHNVTEGMHDIAVMLADKERNKVGVSGPPVAIQCKYDDGTPAIDLISPTTGHKFPLGKLDIVYETRHFVIGSDGYLGVVIDGAIVVTWDKHANQFQIDLSQLAAGDHELFLVLVSNKNERIGLPSRRVLLTLLAPNNGDLSLLVPTGGQHLKASEVRVEMAVARNVELGDKLISFHVDDEHLGNIDTLTPLKVMDLDSGPHVLHLYLVDKRAPTVMLTGTEIVSTFYVHNDDDDYAGDHRKKAVFDG